MKFAITWGRTSINILTEAPNIHFLGTFSNFLQPSPTFNAFKNIQNHSTRETYEQVRKICEQHIELIQSIKKW